MEPHTAIGDAIETAGVTPVSLSMTPLGDSPGNNDNSIETRVRVDSGRLSNTTPLVADILAGPTFSNVFTIVELVVAAVFVVPTFTAIVAAILVVAGLIEDISPVTIVPAHFDNPAAVAEAAMTAATTPAAPAIHDCMGDSDNVIETSLVITSTNTISDPLDIQEAVAEAALAATTTSPAAYTIILVPGSTQYFNIVQ